MTLILRDLPFHLYLCCVQRLIDLIWHAEAAVDGRQLSTCSIDAEFFVQLIHSCAGGGVGSGHSSYNSCTVPGTVLLSKHLAN